MESHFQKLQSFNQYVSTNLETISHYEISKNYNDSELGVNYLIRLENAYILYTTKYIDFLKI